MKSKDNNILSQLDKRHFVANVKRFVSKTRKENLKTQICLWRCLGRINIVTVYIYIYMYIYIHVESLWRCLGRISISPEPRAMPRADQIIRSSRNHNILQENTLQHAANLDQNIQQPYLLTEAAQEPQWPQGGPSECLPLTTESIKQGQTG